MTADMYNQSVFLVLKAAYLYYIDNKSQNEIAKQLKISVATVSRLFKRAKQDKIVEFVIRDPYVECIHLEQGLKDAFGLQDVIIAPGVQNGIGNSIQEAREAEAVKKLVALEGARYIQRIIKEDDVLGITWGSTVHHLINYLNPAQKVNATFVTLHGSIACCDDELDVRPLVEGISRAFSGTKYSLLTEALMSSPMAADMIRQEKNIERIFHMFDEIDISIAGIGSMYPEMRSILGKPEFMSASDLKHLQSQQCYGDIALHFFGPDGQECETDLKDRMINIGFEQFKKIPTKIVVASGTEKSRTLMAALKGKLIDVLIIDYELGTEVLRLKKEEEGEDVTQ